VLWLLERTVSLKIDEAYADLRVALSDKGCKIVSEKSPEHILVKQGSLWGISPKTAKKTIDVNFSSVDSGTKLTYFSKLSSDWKNITYVGCVLAALLVGVCLWIAFDLGAFMVAQKPSFWSWLITFNGVIDFQIGHAFVRLTEFLAAFLSAVIALELVIVVYAKSKIEQFVEATINSVASHP
jgi:hypothetical protein